MEAKHENQVLPTETATATSTTRANKGVIVDMERLRYYTRTILKNSYLRKLFSEKTNLAAAILVPYATDSVVCIDLDDRDLEVVKAITDFGNEHVGHSIIGNIKSYFRGSTFGDICADYSLVVMAGLATVMCVVVMRDVVRKP